MSDIKEKGECVFFENSIMNFYHYRIEKSFYVLKKEGEILTKTTYYSKTEPWWCNHDDNCKVETTYFYFIPNKPAKLEILTEYHRNDNPRIDKQEIYSYSWNGKKLKFHIKVKCNSCGKFKKEYLIADRCYYCGESAGDVICLKCARWKRVRFPENTYYVQVCDNCVQISQL
ncbi:MAG: hypothetical protein ACO2OV_04970 [Thermoproteota archaeon]|jgi:hypothetical protein